MEQTQIHIIGEFTKEQIAKIVRHLWDIQKKLDPKGNKDKKFLIWISNNVFPDSVVRQIIKDNFKDGGKVTDLTDGIEDPIEKAKIKPVGG